MELWAIEYKLANASPEYVLEWLQDNVTKENFVSEERESLENALFSRNEKLINLGLALFGSVQSIGYRLFKSEDMVIKRASLAGRSISFGQMSDHWVMFDDVIPVLIQDAEENRSRDVDETPLLQELLQNPKLPDEVFESLYEKTGHFSKLSDRLWMNLVFFTTRNERLSTPYCDDWADGYAEYTHARVFHLGWDLFGKFPVNGRAAVVLEMLGSKLLSENDIDTLQLIDRWQSSDKRANQSYSFVRTRLVKTIPTSSDVFKELKTHHDLAVRKGYYENLDIIMPVDVKDGFDRDGNDFLDSALYNELFFEHEKTRDALRSACVESGRRENLGDLHYRNLYYSQQRHVASNYPEWFKDKSSGELPFDGIEDLELRQEKRLEYLNVQVSSCIKLCWATGMSINNHMKLVRTVCSMT